MSAPLDYSRLKARDLGAMRQLNALFAEVFADPESYAAAPPSDAYLEDLLGKDHVIALAAVADGQVVGGLVAYEMDKFEQDRREIYIYDLAVDAAYRRQGVATGLIKRLGAIATQRSAWVVYVQADYEDEPAVALYEKLGVREEVLHFDIAPTP